MTEFASDLGRRPDSSPQFTSRWDFSSEGEGVILESRDAATDTPQGNADGQSVEPQEVA